MPGRRPASKPLDESDIATICIAMQSRMEECKEFERQASSTVDSKSYWIEQYKRANAVYWKIMEA